jgi:hypothetical protein
LYDFLKSPRALLRISLLSLLSFTTLSACKTSSTRLLSLQNRGLFNTRLLDQNAIPTDRQVNWMIGVNVGVRGGIPNRTTVCSTVPAGSTAATINTALSDCGATASALAGKVVQLAAGDFTLTAPLSIPSYVTLRGAGADATRLHSSVSTLVAISGRSDTSAPGAITGGYTKGSYRINLAPSPAVSVGDFIGVYQTNEPWVYDADGGTTGVYSLHRVESVSGAEVTIWPALLYGLSASQNPKFVRMTGPFVTSAGLEKVGIYPEDEAVSYPVLMNSAYGSWISNIKIHNVPYTGIFAYQVLAGEFAHVDVLGSQSTGDGYGISLDNQTPGNTAIAVYDSIFDGLFHGLVTSGQQGCVFAYNYTVNEHASNGTQIQTAGLNASHSAEGMMSLWEGNFSNKITSDRIHGAAAYQVLWRNRFTGVSAFFNDAKTATVHPEVGSYWWSIVGNILGDAWADDHLLYKYSYTGPEFDAASSTNNGAIYLLGYVGYQRPLDSQVASTLWRYKNYDYYNRSVVSDSTVEVAMPASLAWPTKPSWFGNRPWPPFDYLNPAQAVRTNIPAGYRYVNGVDTP